LAWEPEVSGCAELGTAFECKFWQVFCKSPKQLAGSIPMKKLTLAVMLGLGLASPVFAADLPAQSYSAPPSYIPMYYEWTGFYVGANGGYGLAHDCFKVSSPFGVFTEEGCHGAGGGVVGGQLGYRWQVGGGPLVLGLEAQGDWANLRGSHTSFVDSTITNRSQLNGFGLFTAQFGYAFNNVLVYAKGGAAVTGERFEDIATFGGAVLGSISHTGWGGAAGLGFEYGVTPNWTVGLEWDHLFMGDRTFNLANAGLIFANDQITRDVDLIMVRVNYKFGGPVVARF
jgi:outer membrane immunogenic protein